MRSSPKPLIRFVARGIDYTRKPFHPHDFPVSPAIETLLSQPTWSVRALLPPSKAGKPGGTISNESTKAGPLPSSMRGDAVTSANNNQDEITVSKLHHLLKLSALPLPKTPEEETKMLTTLRDQIHFVRSIQSVDTRGVEPLITIRDETREAVEEQTITLDTMKPYLALEEKVGNNGTVRRRDVIRTPEQDRRERAKWEIDVSKLGVGSERRRKGKMFFVKRRKEGQGASRPGDADKVVRNQQSKERGS